MAVLGGGILVSVANFEGAKDATAGAGVFETIFVFSLIWSALELITGIYGVKHCGNPEKAKNCFIFGLVIAVCCVISTAWNICVVGFSSSVIIGLLFGLILPALFCYGAKLNQQR